MRRWMGLHLHDWIDYNGVAFSIACVQTSPISFITRMGSHIFGVRQFFIFMVSKRTRMLAL